MRQDISIIFALVAFVYYYLNYGSFVYDVDIGHEMLVVFDFDDEYSNYFVAVGFVLLELLCAQLYLVVVEEFVLICYHSG
jgi:hypothetical protein